VGPQAAETVPNARARHAGPTCCAAAVGVAALLVGVLAAACPAPVGIQDCIKGGGSVGYSATLQGPACHGGDADGCPVSMIPTGPAPGGGSGVVPSAVPGAGSSAGTSVDPPATPPATRDARPRQPSGYDELGPWLKGPATGGTAGPAPASGSSVNPPPAPPTNPTARPPRPTGDNDEGKGKSGDAQEEKRP
jgi:hypothetical protein